MRAIATILLIGVALLPTACQVNSHVRDKQQAEQRWNQVRGRVKYQLAGQQFSGGHFDDAADTVAEALSLDPTRPESYALLAKSNLERNKPASAQQALDMSSQLGLESAELHYLQGVLLEQWGRSGEALAQYAIAQAHDPSEIDYLIALVECLVEEGHSEKARSIIEENAFKVDDDGSIALLSAYIALLSGDIDLAAAHLRTAMAHEIKNDLVQLELGRLLVRSHNYREALALLLPLARQSDGIMGITKPSFVISNGALCRALAVCYMNEGKPGEAKRILFDYAQGHPNDVAAQLLLAKAAIAEGDTITALAAVAKAEERAPELRSTQVHLEVRFVRAVLHWQRGDTAASAAVLREILDRAPRDVDAHCLLAEVLLRRNEQEAARDHFEQALTIDPTCRWAEIALRTLG